MRDTRDGRDKMFGFFVVFIVIVRLYSGSQNRIQLIAPSLLPWDICKRILIRRKIITSNRLDIFAITESWLNSENNVAIVEILNTFSDFIVFQIPRPGNKGCGVAIFVCKVFNITKNLTLTFKSFEHIDITLTNKNFNLRLVVICRPPPSTKNKRTIADVSEFSKLKEELIVTDHYLLLEPSIFILTIFIMQTLEIFLTSLNRRT